jgi:hypothetical protein
MAGDMIPFIKDINNDNIQYYAGNQLDKSRWSNPGDAQDQRFSSMVKVREGDSLFIRATYDDTIFIYSYYIPAPPQQLRFHIRPFKGTDTNYLNQLVAYRGASVQELYIGMTGDFINMYYMGPAEHWSAPELKQLMPLRCMIDTGNTYSADNIAYDTAYAPGIAAIPAATDSIGIATSWKQAQQQAQKEGKLLLLYYEPAGRDKNAIAAREVLRSAANSAYHYTDSFNRHFVLYLASDSERYLFRPYDITQFPAGIIMDNKKQAIVIANHTSLQELSNELWGYYADEYYPMLSSFNRIAPLGPAALQSLSAQELMNYIFYCKVSGEQKMICARNCVRKGYFNCPDLEKQRAVWQLLENKHRIYERADDHTTEFLLNILTDSLLLRSNVDSTNWAMSPAFHYFIRFYQQLRASEPEAHPSFYVCLATTLRRALFAGTDDAAKRKELYDGTLQLIDAAPVMTAIEYPILLHYLHKWGDKEGMAAEMQQIAERYCSQFEQQDAQLVIRSLLVPYYTTEGDDFNTELQRAATFIAGKNCMDTDPEICYTEIAATTLNNTAWYYYTHQLHARTALPWIDAALQLQPQNPFYIDTRAHLLYRSGNTAAGIQEQQRAINAAQDKLNPVYTNNQELETMQSELLKMKTGQL